MSIYFNTDNIEKEFLISERLSLSGFLFIVRMTLIINVTYVYAIIEMDCMHQLYRFVSKYNLSQKNQ